MGAQKVRMSFVRWFITVLLFIAILFNYADRVIWSITAPAFAAAFGWVSSISNYGAPGPAGGSGVANYSLILFAWSLAYAIFNFPGGWIVDKLGLRRSLATFFALWSAFTALTAATFNFLSMLIVRVFMGAAEGPVWPVNSKLVKNWSNKYDESKTFTLAGTGQAVGPVVAATVGVALYALGGWRAPFIFFGVLGLVFAAVWYVYVRDTPQQHRGVNNAELNYILEGKSAGEMTENVVSSRDIWASTLKMVFGTQVGWGVLLVFVSFGYVLFTFLYWLPPLMFSTFAHSVTKSGLYTAAIDVALIVGYLASGPFNDGLLKRFDKVNARRLGALVPMALMIVMVGLSYITGRARELVPTALLLAAGAGLMNLTVGSWAVNAVDLAPAGASATVYGFYNGVLNVMGAFNSIIEGVLFIRYGALVGFVSSVFFMLLFLTGYLIFIRKSTWNKAIELRDRLSAEIVKRAVKG